MPFEHYPKNATVDIPIDMVLFDCVTQDTGETSNITVRFVCLDNGKTYDDNDDTFQTTPVDPTFDVTALTTYPYVYQHILDVSAAAWRRGHYRAIFRHSTSTREFAFDFTIGLVTQRNLGVSAAYDGSTLKCSLWVEEFGEIQTDYTSLTNVQILDGAGGLVSSIGTLTTQTNGIFSFNQSVSLAAGTQYVLAADPTVACYAASPFVFKLRQGLVRP